MSGDTKATEPDVTNVPDTVDTAVSGADRGAADSVMVDLRAPWSRLRADLMARGAVVLAALVCVLAHAPQVVSGALVLLGLVLAAERLARLRRDGALDTVLVTVGASLVTLVLTGIVLGSTAVGLSAYSWGIALPIVSGLGLVIATVGPRPARPQGSRTAALAALRAAPWVAAALVVVGVAVGISERSVTATSDQPVQMSLGSVNGTTVEVVVSSPTQIGPLEIRQTSGQTDLTYPTFTVEPGSPVTVPLTLPSTGRYTLTLSYPDQSNPLRTLVLDR